MPPQAQQQAAVDKLRQFKAKTGREPSILIILVDDMGFGDPGAYGGGIMSSPLASGGAFGRTFF